MKRILLAIASGLVVSASANANTVLTFDELSPLQSPMHVIWLQNGYGGLNWSNFGVINGIYVGPTSGNNGYYYDIVSPPNVGTNGWDMPASFSSNKPFTLVSMSVGQSAYSGKTHFDGYVGNTLTYSLDVDTNARHTTPVAFGWTGLSMVVFQNSSGAVIDNLTIAAVPEPETYAMMLAGLGLLGVAARRRKQESTA
jgi:uncharacterized membrane protein YdcZ (DUF606 family)